MPGNNVKSTPIPSLKKRASVSNQKFIEMVFGNLPDDVTALVVSKPGNPEHGGWKPHRASEVENRCVDANNNYLNCSSFKVLEEGDPNARKENFASCHALVLDDIGSKIPAESLADFEFTWKLETSPSNYQYGLLFDQPVTDGEKATAILDAFINKGWCDAGAAGPMSRWARLPVGINGKPKYQGESGKPFQCRITEWNPDRRYSPEAMVEEFQLVLDNKPVRESGSSAGPNSVDMTGGVYFPVNIENPVIAALKERSLYKTPLGSAKHDMTCPWVGEHTDAIDSGTAYFEPDDHYPMGGFSCMHSHRDKYHIRELLNHLGIEQEAVRHKPLIRVVAGEMHRVVDAAEKVLAENGRHYQTGGLIAMVYTDPETGNPEILPTSPQALTKELSMAASWEKYDKRSSAWVRGDPPARHCSILYDQKDYLHLPVLKGVTCQPYFREDDGQLVVIPGYDEKSGLFGVFDATRYQLPEVTKEAVSAAKAKIDSLLDEFSFASEFDEAATISAIFTAVTRPTLPRAPAFHVRAHVFGSGKSYLCELISAFAGPGDAL